MPNKIVVTKSTSILILFALSIIIATTKYYLMFFSMGDKNIIDDISKIEESLQVDKGQLKDITYRQLTTSYDRMLLKQVKIGQINQSTESIKVGKDKYFYTDFNSNYPNIVDQFEYGDVVDLEFISYKDKRYLTGLSEYKEVNDSKAKEYLLIGQNKIVDNNRIIENTTQYQVIFTRDTVFREKETFIKVEGKDLTEFLNKFNSNKTNYKTLRVSGVFVRDKFYATSVLYGVIYEDEKDKFNKLVVSYNGLDLELEQVIKKVKEYSKRDDYDNLRKLYTSLGTEYSETRSIYGNIGILEDLYEGKKKTLLKEYDKIFRKPN